MTKKRDLRFIWNSNGVHTNSGYGVFSRDLLYRLLDDGWPLAHIAFFGLQAYPITLDGLKIYPMMQHPYGADAMFYHGRNFKADVVFSMQDVPTLDLNFVSKLPMWVPYVPIDQEPVPPLVLNALKHAYKIVTFSEFGRKALEKHGFYSKLILEATDTKIFKPSKKSKEQIRKELGLPVDSFLFGMIAANKENPPRKAFQQVLEAFKMFHDKHKNAAILMETQQIHPKGFPIKDFAKHLGIAERTFFVNQYDSSHVIGSEGVANEMNAMDVYLCPSHTEGFGLTIIEAQACGKPVIVNNCQSMPELVVPGKTGEITDTDYKLFSSQRGYWYAPDTKSLYDKMELWHKRLKSNEKQIAKTCRKHIVDNFDIEKRVKEEWIPFLEELQDEVEEQKKKVPQPQLTNKPQQVKVS